MEGKALYENALELARCMREGAKLHPQAFCSLIKRYNGRFKTCSLGGAIVAKHLRRRIWASLELALGDLYFDPYSFLWDYFPCLYHEFFIYTGRSRQLYNSIIIRNDHRRLSRERIAGIIERWARMKLAELETT